MYVTRMVVVALGRDVVSIANLEYGHELVEIAEQFGMDYAFSDGYMFCPEPHGVVRLEIHIVGAFDDEDVIFIVSEATREVAQQIETGKAKFHTESDDEKSAKNRKRNFSKN